MTLPGEHPMPTVKLKRMARLVALHFECHPARIARIFGVTESYVRQCWRDHAPEDLAPLDESIAELTEP